MRVITKSPNSFDVKIPLVSMSMTVLFSRNSSFFTTVFFYGVSGWLFCSVHPASEAKLCYSWRLAGRVSQNSTYPPAPVQQASDEGSDVLSAPPPVTLILSATAASPVTCFRTVKRFSRISPLVSDASFVKL